MVADPSESEEHTLGTAALKGSVTELNSLVWSDFVIVCTANYNLNSFFGSTYWNINLHGVAQTQFTSDSDSSSYRSVH
jgi:hypothetical protein